MTLHILYIHNSEEELIELLECIDLNKLSSNYLHPFHLPIDYTLYWTTGATSLKIWHLLPNS